MLVKKKYNITKDIFITENGSPDKNDHGKTYEEARDDKFRVRKNASPGTVSNSFAAVLKSGSVNHNTVNESSPAIVLDDACIMERDFLCSLMGKMKDINALSNLFIILANEGFENVNPKPSCNTIIFEDPFGIYKILKRNKDANVTEGDTHTPQYPPGFTQNVEENVVDNIPRNASQPKPNPTTSGNKEKASSVNDKFQASGSILEVMDELIKVGQTMGYNMDGCLGNKAKKGWIQELNTKHRVNFVALQETKMEKMDLFSIKALWGNLSFDYAFSPSIGYSGGILCVWDPRLFVKDNSTVSDSFLAISGTWIPSSTKLLVISVYAPQDLTERRMLWDFIHHLIDSWDGECVLLGDFNEVRFEHERRGSLFNSHGANSFNNFITRTGLIDLPLEGYSFTWAHKSASKMSKLDRFLISEGLLALFPSISALCLDKHLSDHRPILLRELNVDYGPTPFRFFHSWSSRKGFDKMVEDSWKNSVCMESNSIIKLKKKLQSLKSSIKHWLAEDNQKSNEHKRNIQNRLIILDKIFDQGSCNDDLIHERSNLLKELQDFNKSSSLDMAQKAKIRWAIEGDENSKFFHGIINKKRSQLAIHGVLADGDWIVEPSLVKNEFLKHFATRFAAPSSSSITFDYQFPNRLTPDQIEDLERNVSYEEIKRAVWDCGISKSPGPDGFTFEFYRKYWSLIDHDVVAAVTSFFSTGSFPPGCNSSFITLIPKSQEAKMVKDFRPISLIGSMYKIITKVLANRLSLVISELVSDVQSAFVSNRHILDGPFILNELLSWCKHKKSKALIFKIDFEKAFDSVRWDYLDVVLANFGFGLKWRSWIQGCLNSAMGSILVNGSPTSEFKFSKGLKQGDPLSPFLFILIMESLHLSFNNVVNAGLYNGIQIDESLNLSHLFYADDVIFVGKWNSSNLSTIVNVLKWFYLASGLKINLNKSKLMGIGISHDVVASAAKSIGCSILHTPFNYLGVKVGGIMSRLSSWDDVIAKLSARLSKWKLKSLSIGGRLTLIKSVLSSLPLYYMSSFKVPKGVLSKMESIRRNFFNGVENAEKKMSLIGWNKILASKKNGGLGVSSFFAYNRALLFKWIWRFLANGASLWSRFISAIYGIRGALDNSSSYSRRSPWLDIVNEVRKLASKGIDLLSLVKKKVGNGEATSFWNDVWLGDFPLKQTYPRLYFLELDKHVSVASKLRANSLISSFRRSPRSGIEEEQLLLLISNTSSVILPNISDRWSWLLDPSGDFSVKSTREFIDDSMLPKTDVPTRWVKSIPIKINIFAWRVSLDKLPTRLNLSLRGLDIPSIICPLCSIAVESTSHLLFSCQLARHLMIKVVHWWELEYQDFHSYEDWLLWFKNLRVSKRLKDVFEGVCYISWWVIWKFRNQVLLGSTSLV
ncbi:RNA-directed DNA polymerase, eukaryota [Tanacetum coccineum]|uniref:RNA-directed DNA polymerase, eukaryota n=1 Tax=Tanacetum coccineum TaxID=301880 RepID=A0ABQ5F7P7_9ASTR